MLGMYRELRLGQAGSGASCVGADGKDASLFQQDMRCSNTSCSHKHPPGCADDTSDVGLALVEPRWPPLRSASGACESRRKRKRNERVQNTALHLSPEVTITH